MWVQARYTVAYCAALLALSSVTAAAHPVAISQVTLVNSADLSYETLSQKYGVCELSPKELSAFVETAGSSPGEASMKTQQPMDVEEQSRDALGSYWAVWVGYT